MELPGLLGSSGLRTHSPSFRSARDLGESALRLMSQQVIASSTEARESESPLFRLVVLLGFCNLALAQPLYELLGRETDFLVAHDASPIDLWLLVGALSFAIPLVVFAISQLVCRARSSAWGLAHYPAIFLLATLLSAQAWRRFDRGSALLVLFLAAITAAAIVVLIARSRVVAQFVFLLSVLSLAAPLFFLFRSEVRPLWLPSDGPLTADSGTTDLELLGPRIPSKIPVFLVVFDELPVSSLMKLDETIDAERFPHFAALGSTSNWYRRASTVAASTVVAVPAILTGRRPLEQKRADHRSHPANLFTWLGRNYRVVARESSTRLCPVEICGTGRRPGWWPRFRLLWDDLSILYAHRVSPAEWAASLPEVDQTWRDFRAGGGARNRVVRSSRDIPSLLEEFAEQIDGEASRTFYYLHPNLPHVPWRYLPSGQEYGPVGELRVDGLWGEQWLDAEWPTIQAFQRHLLQLAYADRVLGDLLQRLRQAGIFERALVIVTADHGASFRPGTSRREIREENLEDVLEVPLFVKLPGQKEGRVLDHAVETIDILPTIAEVLGTPSLPMSDGRSLLEIKDRSREYLGGSRDKPELRPVRPVPERRRHTLERKARLFGEGDVGRIYRVGRPELVGRSLMEFATVPSSLQAVINDAQLFEDVDLTSSFLPARIFGRILPDTAGTTGLLEGDQLVITLNGVVAATTTTVPRSDQPTFSAMVPPRTMRSGNNEVQIHLLRHSPTGEPVLARVLLKGRATAQLTYRKGRAHSIIASSGREFPVVFGAAEGRVRELETGIVGWALDPTRRRPYDELFIFIDGVNVFDGALRRKQPAIVKQFGTEAVAWSGFEVLLPAEMLAHASEVRVFARVGDLVSDLARSWRSPNREPGDRVQFSIVSPGNRSWIEAPDGARIRIASGSVEGVVDMLRRRGKTRMRVGGWAFDAASRAPAVEIVVTVDGVADHAVATRWARRDLEKRFPDSSAGAWGFFVDLSSERFGRQNPPVIRVFAIGAGGTAAELQYGVDSNDQPLSTRMGHLGGR